MRTKKVKQVQWHTFTLAWWWFRTWWSRKFLKPRNFFNNNCKGRCPTHFIGKTIIENLVALSKDTHTRSRMSSSLHGFLASSSESVLERSTTSVRYRDDDVDDYAEDEEEEVLVFASLPCLLVYKNILWRNNNWEWKKCYELAVVTGWGTSLVQW